MKGTLTLPTCYKKELKDGIIMLSEPVAQPNGTLTCLANVKGSLCIIELTLRLEHYA